MPAKSKHNIFIKKAVELGAIEAKIINAESIVTAAWVRMRCQFGCGGYNQGFCCPPHSPTPEETRKIVDCYKKAILVHCGENADVTKLIVRLEREIFLSGYYKAAGFGAGPCDLCKTCSSEGCTYPEKARPSMEACGIDVFATARRNGYPIEVVKDESSEENYYGLVLID